MSDDTIKPRCTLCHAPMELKRSRVGSGWFYSCTNYPACMGKLRADSKGRPLDAMSPGERLEPSDARGVGLRLQYDQVIILGVRGEKVHVAAHGCDGPNADAALRAAEMLQREMRELVLSRALRVHG